MSSPSQYRQLFDLTGRTAIVTGGSGILGRHFCRALAEFGAAVAVVDLEEAQASEFAAELSAECGVSCLGIGCDVSDPASVNAMVERVQAELGEVRILHNNAATKSSDLNAFFERFEHYSHETWREVMAVNLDGMFLVARAVGARMAAHGLGGSIIQTASIYGVLAPDQRIYEGSWYLDREINTPAVYTTSKAAVIGLTRHLATYWAEKGIRVNSLTPAGMESGQNTTFKERYSARVPLGRMGQPAELVGALVFLASDASSYMTGQNLIVDGGLSAW